MAALTRASAVCREASHVVAQGAQSTKTALLSMKGRDMSTKVMLNPKYTKEKSEGNFSTFVFGICLGAGAVWVLTPGRPGVDLSPMKEAVAKISNLALSKVGNLALADMKINQERADAVASYVYTNSVMKKYVSASEWLKYMPEITSYLSKTRGLGSLSAYDLLLKVCGADFIHKACKEDSSNTADLKEALSKIVFYVSPLEIRVVDDNDCVFGKQTLWRRDPSAALSTEVLK